MTLFVARLAPRLLAATRTIALSLAVAIAAPALAVAQSPAPDAATMPAQVTLTPDMVQRFIASWPDFKALGDKLAADRGVDPSAGTPTGAFKAWSQQPDAKAEIDAIVARHGFASLEEWGNVADSVMLAFSYDEQELSDERLAEVLAEIETSPQVPADQKAAAAEQVREYFAAAQALKPLPENVDTIEPFLDELALVAGGGQDDTAPPEGDGSGGGNGPSGEGEETQD